MIICWIKTDLSALLCVMYSCILSLFGFPYGVLGLVWHLISSIPDNCLPLYFNVIRLSRVYSDGQLNSDSDLVCFLFQILE